MKVRFFSADRLIFVYFDCIYHSFTFINFETLDIIIEILFKTDTPPKKNSKNEMFE